MPAHGRSPENVALELDSGPERGLSAEAAAASLLTAGPNRLPVPERPAYVAIALRQLADPLVALLLGAALVSAEAVAALVGRRGRCDLFHSALQVCLPEGRYVIEQAPAWSDGVERGVVAEGSVGARPAGRFRLFRYEVRRWRDGVVPDVAEAVESPHRLTDDPDRARRLLELVPEAPTPVWGRDELGAGEMWNSNSLISWLIARSGLAVESIHPPNGGRAPGWQAGIVIASRQQTYDGHSRSASPTRHPNPEPNLSERGDV